MKEIPTQRAESFYRPSPALPAGAWDRVPPAERVWRWYENTAQRRLTPPAGVLLGERIYARINHNRWVADCVCGSAQIVTPTDPRFACPECGYGWVQITFPANPEAAEAEVSARAPHERNWWHADDKAWDRPGPPAPEPEKEPGRGPADPTPEEPAPEEPKPEEPAGAGPKGSLSR
ncbi:hypothetical protein OHA91_22740 [Streptomyces erythrochromogenes]|uniref:Uncharacterized protein n=1 Tax=Streptomyces erythrochromogenes TaxID=285574 RepID=A0ABZ1QFE4_9ACTN|nr:hypothetical protein [Streptomyces erythrochromogenes]